MSTNAVPAMAALSLALLAALPGPAGAQPKGGGECFLSTNIVGFSAPDDHTVYLRVGVSAIWRLDLMTDCIDLTFRQSLGLRAGSISPWVCSPLDATVTYHEPAMFQRCPVKAMHELTPDERAALPKRDRP